MISHILRTKRKLGNISHLNPPAKMTRGETHQLKVHFKGKHDDFIVFVDDMEEYKKWQTDKSVPMSHFISAFKVFVTHK